MQGSPKEPGGEDAGLLRPHPRQAPSGTSFRQTFKGTAECFLETTPPPPAGAGAVPRQRASPAQIRSQKAPPPGQAPAKRRPGGTSLRLGTAPLLSPLGPGQGPRSRLSGLERPSERPPTRLPRPGWPGQAQGTLKDGVSGPQRGPRKSRTRRAAHTAVLGAGWPPCGQAQRGVPGAEEGLGTLGASPRRRSRAPGGPDGGRCAGSSQPAPTLPLSCPSAPRGRTLDVCSPERQMASGVSWGKQAPRGHAATGLTAPEARAALASSGNGMSRQLRTRVPATGPTGPTRQQGPPRPGTPWLSQAEWGRQGRDTAHKGAHGRPRSCCRAWRGQHTQCGGRNKPPRATH